MNILITGGAGFIGSHIAELLLEKGHAVTIVDNLSTGTTEFIPKTAQFINKDIREREEMLALFKDNHFDVVYHEAAQTMVPASITSPFFDADENIMGLLSVLDAARASGTQKIIFSSSAAVYGDTSNLPCRETLLPAPGSFYGLTKWMTERYLALYHQYYGLHYTVLRYSNVYGPRQGAHGEGGVVYLFAKALAQNEGLTIFGDGNQTRDFISVHDIALANLAALEKGNESILNISTGCETTLNELAEKMAALGGKDRSIITHEKPRPGDIYRSVLSIKAAQDILGWSPSMNLDNGLKDTLTFFRSHR